MKTLRSLGFFVWAFCLLLVFIAGCQVKSAPLKTPPNGGRSPVSGKGVVHLTGASRVLYQGEQFTLQQLEVKKEIPDGGNGRQVLSIVSVTRTNLIQPFRVDSLVVEIEVDDFGGVLITLESFKVVSANGRTSPKVIATTCALVLRPQGNRVCECRLDFEKEYLTDLEPRVYGVTAIVQGLDMGKERITTAVKTITVTIGTPLAPQKQEAQIASLTYPITTRPN